MAKRILKEEQLIDVIWGATLMGGGGGGAMVGGTDLLDTYKKLHPEKPVELTLLETCDMDPEAYGAVTAGMGAPTVLKNVDFSQYAVNAFNALKEMGAKMDPPRKLEYSVPVELGGFNTFCPMLISLLNDIPFIDCDGAGRAVPALDTLLLHINGLDTSPLAMADGKNNKVMVRFTVFARSSVAYQATQIGVICSALANSFGFTFDSEGHVPGWAVNPNSKLTHIACEAYKHLTGTDMIVEPVHAGVECGAFAEKNPHLDMISVGPTLLDVHTPNETCKIEDVKITTELLIEILERIAK